MSESASCCEQLASASNSASPFARIVALGDYDGPTAGVLECARCSTAYRFEMLAWDEYQDVRVFSLASLPPGSFEELIAACPKSWPPRWPVWVPLWEFPSKAQRQATDQQVDEILNRAGPPEFVVAWESPHENLLVVRTLTAEDVQEVEPLFLRKNVSRRKVSATRDWFAWLGLEKRRVEEGSDDEIDSL